MARQGRDMLQQRYCKIRCHEFRAQPLKNARTVQQLSFAAMRFVRCLLLLVAANSFAAVDPSLFKDLHWRLLGPFRAGRVLAVTGVPGEGEHFYFGSVNGGVWETKDAGRTWMPIFDDQPIGSIGAIAVAPSNAKVIYAGSGEADMRSDIAQGNGMYKSADGGKTWS